jgi:hypothetical protein
MLIIIRVIKNIVPKERVIIPYNKKKEKTICLKKGSNKNIY